MRRRRKLCRECRRNRTASRSGSIHILPSGKDGVEIRLENLLHTGAVDHKALRLAHSIKNKAEYMQETMDSLLGAIRDAPALEEFSTAGTTFNDGRGTRPHFELQKDQVKIIHKATFGLSTSGPRGLSPATSEERERFIDKYREAAEFYSEYTVV